MYPNISFENTWGHGENALSKVCFWRDHFCGIFFLFSFHLHSNIKSYDARWLSGGKGVPEGWQVNTHFEKKRSNLRYMDFNQLNYVDIFFYSKILIYIIIVEMMLIIRVVSCTLMVETCTSKTKFSSYTFSIAESTAEREGSSAASSK